jgi:cell volume regulation protein A
VSDTVAFAGELLVVAVVVVAAVLSNRLTQRLLVPAPALMLVAAAVAVQVLPRLHHPAPNAVEDLVTVALVLILFDGGMGIGWPAFRSASRPIALVGVVGTFLTALGVAACAHWLVGLDWYAAVLVATAVAPTDPAVVFSVLGEREVSGRSGTILEGESGANDPVGIALMASLLTAGGLSGHGMAQVVGDFALQMVVGTVVGVLGGRALLWFMRRVPLPGEGLYPLRTLACALALYGVAAVLHGSGFLAVFVAGILIGEARAPYKREIEHFHSALASLGEIVAFVALGLTVELSDLVDPAVWVPGLVVWAVLAAVVRPLALEPLLAGSGLRRREKSFIMFAGLKGAVPILLGGLIVAEGVPDDHRLYGIVVVVVVLSVVVQGSLVPSVAHRLGVPMRLVEPEPWSLGVRLRDEPDGVQRLIVAPGSQAAGSRIADLGALPESAWISFVVRSGKLVQVTPRTVLRDGDEALVLGAPSDSGLLREVFEGSTEG